MAEHWQTKKRFTIDHPPATVFAYLSRWQHVAEWDPSVISASASNSHPPAVGSHYRLLLRLGWRQVPMDYTISRLAPHHLLELEGRGASFEVIDRIRFTEAGGGTQVDYLARVRFTQPQGRVANRIGQAFFAHYAHRAIERLTRMLNGRTRPPRLTAWNSLADRAVLPGLLGFTRLGYYFAKNRRPVATQLYFGKVIVLTGGTSGIGRAAAEALYQLGAHLVVVGRDANKLRKLVADLETLDGDGQIDIEEAELSLLSEVRRLADRLTHRYPRIDVLINNAGALFNRYARTTEGFERTLVTDLLSPYLLSQLLTPALAGAKGGRIINVTSGGMYTQAMRPQMLAPQSPAAEAAAHDGPTAYARAKRGLVILSSLRPITQSAQKISVHSMHPGWVDTPGLQKTLPRFHRQLAPLLRSPHQGADTIVWLAAAPDAHRVPGHLWRDRSIRATHVFRHTRTTAAENLRLKQKLDRLVDSPTTMAETAG